MKRAAEILHEKECEKMRLALSSLQAQIVARFTAEAARFPAATALELREYREAVAHGTDDDVEACAYRLAERLAICAADFPG